MFKIRMENGITYTYNENYDYFETKDKIAVRLTFLGLVIKKYQKDNVVEIEEIF